MVRIATLIVAIVLGVSVSTRASADEPPTMPGPGPGDLSGIETKPRGRTSPDGGISACSGLRRYSRSLGDIGLTGSDLTGQVNCVVADFDANGSVDFLVWGRHEASKRGLRGTRSFKVLFFDGRKIVRAQTIRHDDYDHAVIWPRGRGSDGACRVSPRNLDGVILPGEGGGSWYYVYEPGSRNLKGELACDE